MFSLFSAVPLAAILTVFLQTSTVCAQTAPSTIWYTEQFTVHSQAVGQDFLIQVSKPVRPQPGKVPVVYLLDGNSLFGMAADMIQGYGYYGDTAPAWLVGIGYPAADYDQWTSRRSHDYVHIHLPAPFPEHENTGGGASFQKFLTDELRPLIAKRYPIDPQRTYLAGHSYGGLFTLHLLLNAPATFNGYIICSPPIVAEPQLLEKAAALHASAPLKVFLGVGAREEAQFGAQFHVVGNLEELAARLRNHDSGAQILSAVFEGKNHGTSISGCLTGGLEFLPAPDAR